METAAFERMTRRIGLSGEPYRTGRGGTLLRASRVLAAAGSAGAALSGLPALPAGLPGRLVAAVSGAALLGASATTRFGVFQAGLDSARDPKYTVVPQRQRLADRAGAAGGTETAGSAGNAVAAPPVGPASLPPA